MRIIQTKFNEHGPVQIQDHGSAFLVSYPDQNNLGYQREKTFTKVIGADAWNRAQAFASQMGNLRHKSQRGGE
tara:strand:- start:433 stop:651 length:219 start_codon:yes stop_codon:yes gene_type:complete